MGEASADIVVLGGGPAGLAAAWLAARRGRSVLLLERAAVLGGMAGSFEVAGVRVDHGSHRLHPATPPPVLAALRGLLGEDLQLRRRNGRLRVWDRWVGFPLRAGELARELPRPVLARIALDAAAEPARRLAAARGPDTFAAVLRAGLGPTLYGGLYAPYAEKLWGLPGERIDGEQARRRVTADSPWKIAAKLVRPRRGAGPVQGRAFWYPRRGFGQLVEALADAAVAAGADVRTGAAATAVTDGAGGAEVRTVDGDRISAGHVLSTVPLPVLARMADPAPDPGVLAAAGQLRFRAMTLAYLVHEGPARGAGRWTGYDAHYLPGAETPVTRISEPANYRSTVDDPDDRTVLCAEIPGAVGDEVWTAGDPDLAELVTDGLARTGLPPVRLAGIQVRRLPHVYPVYEHGFQRWLSGLDAWAGGLRRVSTLGRLGLFAHDNTHHALSMAADAVDAVNRDGSRDPARWAAARARWARHVVED